MRKITKFFGLSGRDKMLFLEALILEVWVGMLLKLIPFRWIPRLFSSQQSSGGSRQSAVLRRQSAIGSPDSATIGQPPTVGGRKLSELGFIKTAIGRASKVSPWKNKCLVSSLAGRWMLNRRKISSQLSLGVAKGANGKTIAHAWIKVSDFEVVEKGGDFSELYLF